MSANNLIQTKIEEHLESLEYFKGPPPIPVISQLDGDLGRLIDKKTSGYSSGILCLILPPFGSNVSTKSNQVILDLTVEIHVMEWGMISSSSSGVQKTAYDVALEIASPEKVLSYSGRSGIHGLKINNGYTPLELEGVSQISTPADEGKLYYIQEVKFKTHQQL